MGKEDVQQSLLFHMDTLFCARCRGTTSFSDPVSGDDSAQLPVTTS